MAHRQTPQEKKRREAAKQRHFDDMGGDHFNRRRAEADRRNTRRHFDARNVAFFDENGL